MWRDPRSWIVAAVVSAAALGGAALYFDAAFPVVSLDLEVTRSQVLERARSRALAAELAPDDARTAAAFGLQDPMAKTYVELEGGGRDVWNRIVSRGEYRPYLWTVRFFRPGRTREAVLRFAPDGAVDGFTLRLPEDEPGPVLTEAEARELAESAAATRWNVDLTPYRLVESAQETLPGGRTDHSFVYEERAGSVAEARFRLRLEVAGDRLSEVRRFVLVPEAFERRYREMRSSNDFIAFLSTLGAGLLYVLVGCGVGLFVLLREGRTRWRGALAGAGVVAVLLFGAQLNQLPLAWMQYDTAVPPRSFWLQRLGVAGAILVGGGLLMALIFGIGEGLTRKAFGHHPRLWRSWARGVGNSRDLLGRTLGGYLFTAAFIPYTVAFYFFSTRILGWWTPAEALVQPDLVATPLPWLSAVATSLFAGTFEEALFRAVPLAGAALIGERTGRRKHWIGAALVLQTVIFAGAHANYPQQPSYARLVELLLPAFAFGVIYLRFGLLPAILGHFTYDLLWMSLPLWASGAPGIWLDRTMIVVAGLAPLAVVVVARIRWGARETVAEAGLNRSDGPAPVGPGQAGVPGRSESESPDGRGAPGATIPGAIGARSGASSDASVAEPRSGFPPEPRVRPVLVGTVAVAGLLLWGVAERPTRSAPALELGRGQARALVRDTLAARGVPVGAPWRTLARPRSERGLSHRFVHRELGEESYRRLLGSYLRGPGWDVRHARFRGSVEERAEEWRIRLDRRGRIVRIHHVLPEGAPGESLSEDEARELALEGVLQRLGFDPDRLREVSAESQQRPARVDWRFVFADRVTAMEAGEARVRVDVAGMRVVDLERTVHVPEEWRRDERSRQSRRTIRLLAGGGLLLFLVGGLAVFALVRWSRGSFGARAFAVVGLVVLGGIVLEGANGYPATLAGMSTAEPLSQQVAMLGGQLLLGGLFAGALFGLLAGLLPTWSRRRRSAWPVSAAVGLAGGALLAGLGALAGLGEPVRLPPWPDVAGAGHVVVWLEPLLDAGAGIFLTASALGAAAVAGEILGRGSRRRSLVVIGGGSLVLGYAFAAVETGPSLAYWLVAGAVWAAAVAGTVVLVRWVGRAVIPPLVAVPAVLEEGAALVAPPYPGARPGALLAGAVVLAIALWWSRSLARVRVPPSNPPPPEGADPAPPGS